MGRRLRLLLIAVVAVVCAACSSSGSSGNGSGGSSASSAPIRIMGEGVFNSPEVSLPDAEAAMKAAVATINAAGGVNGHQLSLDVCDDQNDPNLASGCARSAVSNHDVAVVSAYTAYTPEIVPILQAASIPYFNTTPSEQIDFTSPDEFPLTGGLYGETAALGQAMVADGCTKIGQVVAGTTVNEQGAEWLEKGAKSKGASVVSVQVSNTATDFAAPVAQLESSGVQCIVTDTAPPAAPKIVTAVVQSGKKLPIGAVSPEFGDQTLQTMGAEADGMVLVGHGYRPADTVPAVAAIRNGMAKYTPGTPPTEAFSIDAWTAVTVAASVIGHVSGTVTGASVLSAANATTSVDSNGLLAAFAFNGPSPIASLPRAKNWGYTTWKVEGGRAQLVSPKFLNLTGVS